MNTLKNFIIFVLMGVILSNQNKITVTQSQIDLSNEENRFLEFEQKLLSNFESNINLKNELVEQLTFLSNAASEINDKDQLGKPVDGCDTRPDQTQAGYYFFLPVMKSKLKNAGDSSDFINGCFKTNRFTLEKLSLEETVVTIHSADSKNFFCNDLYWISTSNIHSLKEVITHGEHRVVLKNLSQDDLDEIKVNGIKLFSFCQSFFKSLESLFLSLKLYIGGLGKDPNSFLPILRPEVPKYMEKANLEFLAKFANFKPLNRGDYGNMILPIDETEIKSGDFVAIYRFDGLDPLIMFGSGARIGHSAVACWIEGELYVLESQDGWYWPKGGIQRNKWKTWVQWAHNADFSVAILPLKEEIRQKFDVEKALSWFTNGIEKLDYGYHNFLFSWLDTAYDNLPNDLVQTELLLSIFSILEKVSKSTATTIIGEALNQRLKTKGLSIPQVTALAARKNLSFEELLAIVEEEGWQYSDGKNYVCSCFVVGFWKAGGLFDGLSIESTEFTPKDIYQLDFFDKSYKDRRPQICKDADPNLEYCQVVGRYQVVLEGYSTVHPYSHMNERCPSIAPLYERPDGC